MNGLLMVIKFAEKKLKDLYIFIVAKPNIYLKYNEAALEFN